jgi:hypothetical protein
LRKIFSFWEASLRVMILRFINATCSKSLPLFLSCIPFCEVYHTIFIHSPVDGNLAYFHFRTVRKKWTSLLMYLFGCMLFLVFGRT